MDSTHDSRTRLESPIQGSNSAGPSQAIVTTLHTTNRNPRDCIAFGLHTGESEPSQPGSHSFAFDNPRESPRKCRETTVPGLERDSWHCLHVCRGLAHPNRSETQSPRWSKSEDRPSVESVTRNPLPGKIAPGAGRALWSIFVDFRHSNRSTARPHERAHQNTHLMSADTSPIY